MNCISSLLVIKDNHVSFFHKSVKEWLVSEKDHIYRIDENHGHFALAKLCAECFDKILKSSEHDESKLTDAEMYALENGFYHMIKDEVNVISHVNSYLENFELICRCTISVLNLFKWLDYLRKMTSNSQYKGTLNELESIVENLGIVYFHYDKNVRQCGLLQCLILDAPEEISSKAMELHTRFFRNRPYVENVCEHNENANEETIVLFSREKEHCSAKESSELSFAEKTSESCSKENKLSSVDVRNLFDYVVLCFESGVVVLISIEPLKVMWTKTFPEEEISCSCIAFHPHHDLILRGRIDQVLSLTDGSWQPGPFVCTKNYFFTECCFSPDNNIMMTGNNSDEHLALWDLVSGKKKRCIEVGGQVWSCSFSSNGSYFAFLITGEMLGNGELRRVDWSVFDVVNNYTHLYESIGPFTYVTGKVPLSLTASKSDIWFVSHSTSLNEFCYMYNGKGMRGHSGVLSVPGRQIFFPPATKSHEIVDRSITSQIMPNFKYFRHLSFVSEPTPSYLINLHDELNLAITCDNLTTLQFNRLASGNISFDGRYFYQHSQSLRQLRVLKRDGKVWILANENVYQNIIAFAVVINGVFIVTAQRIVEMWNIEMTQRLMDCQQMAAIVCCESVSDDLIACVGKTEVSFINSHNLHVVSTTLVSLNQLVLACSSKYDVLVKDIHFQNGECFIMRNNKKTLSLPNTDFFQVARFSPNANKLVLLDAKYNNGYRCYDMSESSMTTVSETKIDTHEILCFLDDEYFITIKAYKTLRLNSIHSTKIHAMITFDQDPTSIFYCHTIQTLIVNYMNNKFHEFRLK